MKKVLTLVSALSMVAGSAFANDYDWQFGDNGVNNPKTDANHNGKRLRVYTLHNSKKAVTAD